MPFGSLTDEECFSCRNSPLATTHPLSIGTHFSNLFISKLPPALLYRKTACFPVPHRGPAQKHTAFFFFGQLAEIYSLPTAIGQEMSFLAQVWHLALYRDVKSGQETGDEAGDK